MRTWVKICGITAPEAGAAAAAAGADAVGFLFAPSARRVSADQAGAIGEALPPHIRRVGVFVDAGVVSVRATAAAARLHAVQLHGEEPPEAVEALRQVGLWVIKALRIGGPASLGQLAAYRPDAFLLDANVSGVAGGSGQTFDWELARQACSATSRPVILSGGLSPENVTAALAAVHPFGVDVSSGVERAPGEKDPARVRAFVERVRRYDGGAGAGAFRTVRGPVRAGDPDPGA